jgi:predicted amidohydrolase
VASAQVGKHNERIITYGHSLVIDPWGDILLDAKEDTGHFIVDIDLKRINEIRKSVKVFK